MKRVGQYGVRAIKESHQNTENKAPPYVKPKIWLVNTRPMLSFTDKTVLLEIG